jgi:mRNA interferase RelE/StbE
MNYRLFIRRSAQRGLASIPKDDRQSVIDAIHALAIDPRPRGCKKLADRDAWRIRVGSYRVIYEIDDAQTTVTVTNAGHRRDIYRK